MSEKQTVTPDEAIDRLIRGNERYVNDALIHHQNVHQKRRAETTASQHPYATILGCSDSRASLEHIFDAGLGDLFVCRNAGNILDEITLGSIEYAAHKASCPLLVVMGHQFCGAVTATVNHAKTPDEFPSPSIGQIITRLLPCVMASRDKNGKNESEWIEASAKRNVEMICQQAVIQSRILRQKIEEKRFRIIGAYYSLETGKVELFE